MSCRVVDLRYRDVVNMKDGCRLGCINDVEIDTVTARVLYIVVYGRPRCFGLFGREDDIVIPWESIQVIGEDAVLVSYEDKVTYRKRGWFGRCEP